jgi:hypothetical protein
MPNRNKSEYTHLRHLTIYVDEPDPGSFFWVLIESTEDSVVWKETRGSEDTYGTWVAAFDAGVAELKSLIENIELGPRATGEDESAHPVG